MKIRTAFLPLVMLAVVVGTCPPARADKPLVVASFYPLYEFAKQVAGIHAEVVSLVPVGIEPHDWEPAPQDVIRVQHAKLFVYNGAGLEAWVEKSIPDMKFDIKEVLVSGDRVIVRGEVSGTPAGDLFGVAHTGKSFRIMAIDIQTVRDGKIARTYHLENWLSALGQLRAK